MKYLLSSMAFAAPKAEVTKIKDGVLKYTNEKHPLFNELLELGFDDYGYNYQAHLFNGTHDQWSTAKNGTAGDEELFMEMKWNDEWLSNVDANGDGKLDRPNDNDGSYIGSGAWEIYKEYTLDENGEVDYEYMCKIIAAPVDATKSGGYWYSADGEELGYVLWEAFFVSQEVSTDPDWNYDSPVRNGLGNW